MSTYLLRVTITRSSCVELFLSEVFLQPRIQSNGSGSKESLACRHLVNHLQPRHCSQVSPALNCQIGTRQGNTFCWQGYRKASASLANHSEKNVADSHKISWVFRAYSFSSVCHLERTPAIQTAPFEGNPMADTEST